jgi:DNA-binding beta-propeller fold protein YncE
MESLKMYQARSIAAVLGLIGLAALDPASGLAADAGHLYTITKTIPLGSPERWDYLTYDPTSHRVYAAHGTSIAVVDGRSGALLGSVPVPGANGVAVIPSIGKGYAGSSTNKSVLVFDLVTFKVLKELPADEDTDGVVYDPVSKRVFVMDGDPHNAMVIDTITDTVVTRLPLAGKPEFAAVDGAGKLFVNITDARQIQRIDTKTLKTEATWPISDCEGPHGLAIDAGTRRLLSSCLNSKLLVVDSASGRIVATLPIGPGSDATAFDSKRNRVFSSNGSGTLTVIHENGPDNFVVLAEVPTQLLARTMAVDSETGRVYLLAGDRIEVDPTATNPRKRYGVRAGSVRLLFVDPAT